MGSATSQLLTGAVSTLQFLEPPPEACHPDTARAVLLPVPLELTVSYGAGTASGPQAILQASTQVELYDREFGCDAVMGYGVHTLPSLDLPPDPAAAVEAIARRVAELSPRLVGCLGGEHSLTLGAVRGLIQAGRGPLTVVFMDAHSDLRQEYQDSPYSHACVARRLLEEPGVEQILQLGIRSLCQEEAELIASQPERLRVWFAEEVHQGRWGEELQQRLQGRQVYLTLDVDGLDPAVMPATGTPEPDGLSWSQAMELIRRVVAGAREVVGFDCVELAPRPELHHADYTAAKLVYKTLSYLSLKTNKGGRS